MQRIARSILHKSMACYPLTRSPKPSYLTSMILPFPPPNHSNPRENQVCDRVKGEVDYINVQIPQVREQIKYATESKGMRDELPENERSALRQSMGPKIEEMKAELLQLEVDEINTCFTEAREDIENAMGMEQDGVYKAELVLEMFERLLRLLSALRRSMGPKIEQMKAEFLQLEVDEINTWFAEAREDIENAMEMEQDGVSARYTAKSEEYEVELVFEMIDRLLRILPKKSALRRSILPFPPPNHSNPRENQVCDRVKGEVDYINVQIPRVREKIKYATESKGMRDADYAGKSMDWLLIIFDHVMDVLPEIERSAMGPKIEQMKAEFLQLVVDEINTWFAEAREDIENAMKTEQDGVYTRCTAESVQYQAELVLEMFERLLRMLPRKSALRQSMGTKVELLNAEFHQVEVVYFNTKFDEARVKIKAAMESKEMEDAECAREAVNSVLGMFNHLLMMLLEKECSELGGLKIKRLKAEAVDFNTKFAEAREEIEVAKETEDAECARAALNSVLGMYDGLLAKLPENSKLRGLIGLKIELLQAKISLQDEKL